MANGRTLRSTLGRVRAGLVHGAAWVSDGVLSGIGHGLGPGSAGMLRESIIARWMARTRIVHHGAVTISLSCPNHTALSRAKTFATKEPQTLSWIESFEPGSIFWDVGANVGLYSLFAAKAVSRTAVYAIEPSVFNLELLARNIDANQAENICVVPIALCEARSEAKFSLTRLDHAGSMSAFGVSFGSDGGPMAAKLQYKTIGVSADEAISLLRLPQPNHIKIDVDGIEHLILRGAPQTLANPELRSVLVEVSRRFRDQKDEVARILSSAGFRTAVPIEQPGRHFYNAIWRR